MPEPVEPPPGERSLEDVKHGERRELEDIPPEEHETLLGQALKDQVDLKRGYGRSMLWIMAGQLIAADALFLVVAWAGYDWKVSDSVMHVWLAGTFVQIIGVVAIIVRGLFSGDDVRAAASLGGGD